MGLQGSGQDESSGEEQYKPEREHDPPYLDALKLYLGYRLKETHLILHLGFSPPFKRFLHT